MTSWDYVTGNKVRQRKSHKKDDLRYKNVWDLLRECRKRREEV